MRKFLRNLLLALIPLAVINALCWGTLVFLAQQANVSQVLSWLHRQGLKNG